jgi:hypothetical protein
LNQPKTLLATVSFSTKLAESGHSLRAERMTLVVPRAGQPLLRVISAKTSFMKATGTAKSAFDRTTIWRLV